jgi:hypothetical protein
MDSMELAGVDNKIKELEAQLTSTEADNKKLSEGTKKHRSSCVVQVKSKGKEACLITCLHFAELSLLKSQPGDAEIDAFLSKLTDENAKLQERLSKIESKGIVITADERKQAESAYETYRVRGDENEKEKRKKSIIFVFSFFTPNHTSTLQSAWRKRKRMVRTLVNCLLLAKMTHTYSLSLSLSLSCFKCKSIVDELCERAEKKPREFVEEIGIETDEQVSVSIDSDRTTKVKRGEILPEM